MSSKLPNDWWIEHTGERLILDQEKVAVEIERLRWALRPFAEIGRKLHDANQTSDQSKTIGASARFLKLEPLTGHDFVNAHNALEQGAEGRK